MGNTSLLLLPFLLFSILPVSGCANSPKRQSASYAAGEKATVGPLTYSVIDTELLPRLGDDPATARTPVNRFYLVRIAVSNASSSDVPIPGFALVDDSGKTYAELADGSQVPNWLGVVRRAAGSQTEQGTVVFDAPAQHYRLRLTDETDEKEVSIDIPLNFLHEQMKNLQTPLNPAPGARTPAK